MKNSYEILPLDKLIIETYNGTFSLLSFIKLKRKQILDPNYKENFNYILDFRNVYFPDYQKYQDILYFIELFTYRISTSKCAFITQNPNQVVESILFMLEAEKLLPVSFKIFSGIKPAYAWIKGDYVSMYQKE